MILTRNYITHKSLKSLLGFLGLHNGLLRRFSCGLGCFLGRSFLRWLLNSLRLRDLLHDLGADLTLLDVYCGLLFHCYRFLCNKYWLFNLLLTAFDSLGGLFSHSALQELIVCEFACRFRITDQDIFLVDIFGGFKGSLLLRTEEMLDEGATLIVTEQVLRVLILQFLLGI